ERLRGDAIGSATWGAARPRSGRDRLDTRRAALDNTRASLGDRARQTAAPHAEPGRPYEGWAGAHALRVPWRGRAVPGDGPGRLQHRRLRHEHAGRHRGAARHLALVPVDV